MYRDIKNRNQLLESIVWRKDNLQRLAGVNTSLNLDTSSVAIEKDQRDKINEHLAKSGFDGSRTFRSTGHALNVLTMNLLGFGITPEHKSVMSAIGVLSESRGKRFLETVLTESNSTVENTKLCVQWDESDGKTKVVASLA